MAQATVNKHIRVPPDLAEAIEAEARRRGVSENAMLVEIIRAALED